MLDRLPLNATIGRYRLTEFLGQGGMGQVYGARQVDTGEFFAVKALGSEAFSSPTALARFRNEAIIQYNLKHPCIARIHEYVEYAGRPCIVMEYVDGLTLEERLRRDGALPFEEALPLFRELVAAIGYVHGCGVVHRDLKASNIKITSAGQIKILDFGIAYEEHAAGLTRVGHVIGTLENLAPEQAIGAKGDARSDIWALGVLFYQMLTARMPFEDSEVDRLTTKILTGRYTGVRQLVRGIPPGAERVIGRCLSRQPSDRYPNTAELLAALDRSAGGVRVADRASDAARWLRGAVLANQWVWVAGGLAAAVRLLWLGLPRPAPDAPVDAGLPAAAASPSPARIVPARKVPVEQPRVEPREPRMNEYIAQPRPEETTRIPQTAPVPVTPAPVVVQTVPPPAPRPAVPPPAQADPPRPKPADPNKMIAITVETSNGPASIYMDGELLGETPYRLGAQTGVEVHLVLKRPGFKDKAVTILAGDRPGPYRYQMEP